MKPTIITSSTIRSNFEIYPHLESPEQWLDWYSAVRNIARRLDIWHTMDPTQKDQDDDRAVPPKAESYSSSRKRTLKEAREEYRIPPLEGAIIMLHSSLCKEAEIKMKLYREMFQKQKAMRGLIMASVPDEIYKGVMNKVTMIVPKPDGSSKRKSKPTLCQLLRILQNTMTQPERETKTKAMGEYLGLYGVARSGRLSYKRFEVKWSNTLRRFLDCMAPVVALCGDDKETIEAMKYLGCCIQCHERPTYNGSTNRKAALSLYTLGAYLLLPLLTRVNMIAPNLDDVRFFCFLAESRNMFGRQLWAEIRDSYIKLGP